MSGKICEPTGVTLVELAVVIAVISVLALIATPRVMDFKNAVGANEAARQIVSDMQLARSRAIFENKQFRITFNEPSTDRYRMKSLAAGATDWASATTELSQSLPGGVVFKATGMTNGPDGTEIDTNDWINFTDNSVTFIGTGTASPPGTVYVMPTRDINERTDRIRAVRLQFAQTAKVKVYKYDADSATKWVNF